MNDPEREKWLHDEAMSIRLRDQFACAALTGLIACPDTSGSPDLFAGLAYGYADAMLKAREVKP